MYARERRYCSPEEEERSGLDFSTLDDIDKVDITNTTTVTPEREDSWRKTLEDLQEDKPTKPNFDIPSFLK